MLDTQRRGVVIGIGASAGGLRPIQDLLGCLPLQTGCAFVVVQHSSPDFESLMSQVLARSTKIPIQLITDGLQIQSDTIYLNPPSYEVRVCDGRFVLAPFDDGVLKLPIDSLFDSLASEYGQQAVAVVLSGTGSDGTQGIKSVSDAMGLTIVQSVESAQFDGMPLNAIRTGRVDYVLPPNGIAELIAAHAAKRVNANQTVLDESLQVMNGVQLIFSLLESQHSIDFSHYKPTTVARRIDRRVQMGGFAGLPEYALEVQKNEDELTALYHDLLIGVTQFFRDTEAFELLKKELFPMIGSATKQHPLRVWSAGCASGEEAYSIAILLHELFEEQSLEQNFKVFATDVHDRTLEVAARGVYPADSVGKLPENRQSFFVAQANGSFKVSSKIRNHIVFAKQNAVTDPPFTKMGVVTCRNMLIYLQDEAQNSAISNFRYALKADGILFLGPSETLGKMSHGFDVVDKNWRLFRKNSYVPSPAEKRRSNANHPLGKAQSRTLEMIKSQTRVQQLPEAIDRFLADHVDATLLIDHEKNVLHAFGDAKRYVEERFGDSAATLDELIVGSTKAAVFALISQALHEEGREFTAQHLDFSLGENNPIDHITAKAIALADSYSMMVVLRFLPPAKDGSSSPLAEAEEGASTATTTGTAKSTGTATARSPSATGMTALEEPRVTQGTLGASVREPESINEALQSTNEEKVASNEELQETNEELQSAIEELQTVNHEHQRKVRELEEMTDDFNNLLDVTDAGLILLDEEMRIRKFTKVARNYFDLLPHDIGRRLTNFVPKINLDGLFEWIRKVVTNGKVFATHAEDQDGNLISVKVSPYRTNDEIKGVVLYLSDLATTHRREREIPGQLTVNPSDGIWHWYPGTGQMWWSPNFYKLLGIKDRSLEPTKDRLRSLIHPSDRPWFDSLGSAPKKRDMWKHIQIKHSTGAYLYFELHCTANNNAANNNAANKNAEGSAEELTGVLRPCEERLLVDEKSFPSPSSRPTNVVPEKQHD